MKNKKKLLKHLNSLNYKANFKPEDEKYIDADRSVSILLYSSHCFPNTYNLLKLSNVYNNYIVKKIKSFIKLEYEYHTQGYRNTGDTELANADVVSYINSDLKPIEKILKKNQHLILKYSYKIKNKHKLKFYLDQNNNILDNFDLDQNSFIVSES